MDFNNKNVLVVGMAKSGISAAILLKKLGANVTIADIKEREKLGDEPSMLEALGIDLYLGRNPSAEDISRFELVVVSPGVPPDLPFFSKIRQLNIPVWAEIELAYRLCKCPVLAITGTNGKTTTTALTGEILKTYNSSTEIVGNIGIPFTDKVLTLNEESYVVIEVSSFQLEAIHAFKPKISAVLNITPDHLNRHKTMESYIDIKKSIFKNQDENDFLILNYDDEICRNMSKDAKCRVYFFSRKNKLSEGVFVLDKSIYAKLNGYDEKIIDTSELQIIGEHNVENAMAAAAMLLCAGVPIDIVRTGLIGFKAVAHRMEFVTTINEIDFYNDSKGTNPDAAIKSINAIDKPIVLIGGGYDKGSDFSEWVKAFEGKVKHLVVIGESANMIIETAKAYNFSNFEKANTLKDAVDIAYSKACGGDCILLSPACASWDMFDNFEQRGDLFKEFVFSLYN